MAHDSTFLIPEVAAQPTPQGGNIALYAKSDKQLYYKDDTGTENLIGSDTSQVTTNTAQTIPGAKTMTGANVIDALTVAATGPMAMFGATLVTTQASALTTQSLAALTAQALATLSTVDLSVLTSNPVVFLDTVQISALQTTVNAMATELEVLKGNANKVVGAVPTLNTNNTSVSSILHNIGATA